MADVIWEPTPEIVERANVTRLMRRYAVSDYDALVARSIAEPEWFWPAVVEDLGLEFSTPWEEVLDTSRGVEWSRWFVGGRLNIARHCVHRWAERRPDAEAAVFAGEDGSRRTLSFAELSDEVTLLAEGLSALGIGAGVAVATVLPMAPEAAVATHACAHLGAMVVPIFSGFGAQAIAARLTDAGARVVITADGSLRRGRVVEMKETVDEAVDSAPTVEHVVVWERLGRNAPAKPGRDVLWSELVAGRPGRLPPSEVDSESPFLLAYTSGTTGRPKGTVHVQGGLLVSFAREAGYLADVGSDDTILFATDMGWIMGPWTVVGAGALGARIVYLEGAPDWPPDRLWRLIERERVTVLGVSPTLVRALAPHGPPRADLSSLRILVTTGEPWNDEPYRWLLETVGGGRCPIINISGGTECGAVVLGPTPVCPLKPCSLYGPSLGIAAGVVDAEGRPVARGEVGELVITRPFPGMTRGLWHDPERYLDAYWRRLPGTWVHGDWASIDADGHWYVLGRSDDTLNVAGKRIGPAELESAAVAHPAVLEAAAVGMPHDVKGETAWLFCVVRGGGTDAIAAEVADTVAAELGKAFRPERVVLVPSLPKTRSAKIVRRAVRARALGEDPGDISTIENPEALEAIAAAVFDQET
jgi:acetyl-CoA synthetase